MKGSQLGDGHNQAAEFDGCDGARRMPRDLFPLPGIAVESVQQTSLSRRCRRRIEKRSHVQREVDGCLAGLNQLYSFAGNGSDLASEREVNSSQISSIEFVKACVDDLGPPGQLTGSEALDALRVSEGYEELPTSSTRGSYNPEAVSLPAGEVFPIDLAGLWGDDGRDVVQNFIDEQLLDENAALSSIECLGPARVYEDPKLRSRSAYAGFIKRLASLGLVDFSTVAAKEEVGIFFVKKKQNKLRLIFDCRRSNRWFREPTPVTLTTGESLRRIELGAEDRLYVCNADLANAFYTLATPKELRQFFGLRSVLAGDVGIDNLQGVAVKKNQRIFPRIAVLPMGWSWALYWCQHIHQNIAERSGLTQEERLQDFRAAHSRGFWHVQYVDNLHVIGTNKTEVETRFWKAVEELKKSGLTVHEEEVCDSQAKVLGWEYESKGVMRPSRSRVWKIRLAIREVLRRGCLSGVQLERLIGHITFVSLGRRELLSIFGECYTFIRRNYKCNVPMWKSVRKELQTWDRLSPLIVQDLRSKWSEHVCAVDASEWGLGVVEATMDIGSVQKLGSFSERWRFKSPDFSNARLSVSQEEDRVKWLQELEDESIVVEAIPARFENVQFRHVTRDWSLIGRYRWKRVEAMPVLEAKANLYAVKHAVRRVSGHRKRHLVLTDSMTAALAIGKGRSASWKMRAVVQKISAILLATGSSLQCRWIPSEWNPADGPSRGETKASIPKPVDFDGALQRSAMSSSVAGEKNNQGTVEAAEGVRETGGSIIKHATDLGHRDGKDESIGKEDKEKCKKEDKGYGRKTIRHVHPSSLKCETRHTAEVPRTLEQPDGVVQAESNERENHRRHRHLHREVPGGVVFGRRRSECGELCGGLSEFSQTRATWVADSSAYPPITQGVASPLPTSVTDASALRSDLSSISRSSVEGEDRDKPCPPTDLLLLSSSHRVREAESLRHCGTSGERRRSISLVECLATPHGDGHPIKDSSVGRGTAVGSPIPTVPWRGHAKASQTEDKAKGGKSIQGDLNRSESIHDVTLEAVGPPPTSRPTPISSSTRRSISRHSLQTSNPPGGSSTGKMDGFKECEELREGEPVSPALRKPQQRHSKKVSRGKKNHRPGYPQPAMKPGLVLHFSVFLEIFCGTGRLGHSIYNNCGWPVLLWDISFGENYDLTQVGNQQKILTWLYGGVIRAGHLGTPCNSFSRARDQPGGPPQLRSDLMPLGLPNLRPGDANKVKLGNILLRFSVKVMKKARDLFIAFTIENPARSRLWICPPMSSFLRLRGVQQALVEFCAFGTRWRKSTKFVGVHVSFDCLSMCRCLGARRGLCKFTGRQHIALSGQNASGQWWTRIAEPYPRGLCRKLATIFSDFEVQQLAKNFAKHTGVSP